MRDNGLYATILGITSPWSVSDVRLQPAQSLVEVQVTLDPLHALACPVCAAPARRYDSRERRWRHLDTCQYRTLLVADVPRVECREHGVHQVFLPWAEPGSRFTALFEALVIDWLKEASISAVARQLRLSWAEVDGVMQRAVTRGLARRKRKPIRRVGVDETSFARRHEYVMVDHPAADTLRGAESLLEVVGSAPSALRANMVFVAIYLSSAMSSAWQATSFLSWAFWRSGPLQPPDIRGLHGHLLPRPRPPQRLLGELLSPQRLGRHPRAADSWYLVLTQLLDDFFGVVSSANCHERLHALKRAVVSHSAWASVRGPCQPSRQQWPSAWIVNMGCYAGAGSDLCLVVQLRDLVVIRTH